MLFKKYKLSVLLRKSTTTINYYRNYPFISKIFLTKLRSPPGVSIAIISKNINFLVTYVLGRFVRNRYTDIYWSLIFDDVTHGNASYNYRTLKRANHNLVRYPVGVEWGGRVWFSAIFKTEF